ncbi:MAG: hypothetical protein LUM44_06350 [Pyrinomonadaceae bacterium]|nr:hypothetical protein [Pyrinomonadaceae bacterium]
MNENTKEDFSEYDLIRQFLLHQLAPASSAKIEERFFCEPEFKEFVLLTEEELMEDYVLEKLSFDERLRVQKYLLSTKPQQEKLQSITEMVHAVKPIPPKSSSEKTLIKEPWYASGFFSKYYAFAAVLLLICVSVVAVFLLNRRNPSSSLNAALLEKIEILNRENAVTPENVSSAIFEISRISERSPSTGQNNRVFIKADDEIIEFHLAIPANEYKTYRAVLNKFNSPPLATIKNLSLSQKDGLSFLRVKYPAKTFEKGYYEIHVSGIESEKTEDLGTFNFEVVLTN